jgi:membrane protease YdiL (CAAX protease family)
MMFVIGTLTDGLIITKLKPVLNFSIPLFALKMFFVAFFEETFFRGYLFTTIYYAFRSRKIANRQASLIALFASSIIFGIAHLSTSNASFISTLLLSINGMIWCIPFILTKNLGLSIGLHTAWNFTQTQIGFTMSGNKAVNSFYRIEKNGSNLWTGGEYGPEAGILGLLGMVTMLWLSLTYLNLQTKKSRSKVRFKRH